MKLLGGLLCLVIAKTGLEAYKKRGLSAFDDLVGGFPRHKSAGAGQISGP